MSVTVYSYIFEKQGEAVYRMESLVPSNRPMISAKCHDAWQVEFFADLEAVMDCLKIVVFGRIRDQSMRHSMNGRGVHVSNLLHNLIVKVVVILSRGA